MIREDMIFIGGELKEKQAIITFLVQEAYRCGLVDDCQAFENAVLRREAEISTSVGHCIAIPHGKTASVKNAFVAYFRAKEAFEWDVETKDMVHSIFMIGVPEKNGDTTHLRYISQISKKLIDDSFREQLFQCKERGAAFRLLSLMEHE